MLDLISSNPDGGFWERLREEATEVFNTADDWKNPASLPKLPLADSTICESLRKNPMLSLTILREVMPKDGVTLPSGHHVPKCAWMAAVTVGLHHDDAFYPKPKKFDPFRFAKRQEDIPVGANEEVPDRRGFNLPQESESGYCERYLLRIQLRGACLVSFSRRSEAFFHAHVWQSRPLARSSPAQVNDRLCHFELRHPVHQRASRE